MIIHCYNSLIKIEYGDPRLERYLKRNFALLRQPDDPYSLTSLPGFSLATPKDERWKQAREYFLEELSLEDLPYDVITTPRAIGYLALDVDSNVITAYLEILRHHHLQEGEGYLYIGGKFKPVATFQLGIVEPTTDYSVATRPGEAFPVNGRLKLHSAARTAILEAMKANIGIGHEQMPFLSRPNTN